MEIVCIGDLHGRSNWIDIVNEHNNSNFIFLGDYIDPYSDEFIETDEAVENLELLIDFKKNFHTKVSLLIGNHDAQYIFYPSFRTGALAKGKYLPEILNLFRDNKNLFQFAIQKENYLFTHAGISNGWFNEYYRLFDYFGLNPDKSNLAMTINKIGRDPKWRDVLGDVSHYRGGSDRFGGPLWVDRMELYQNYLTGFHQVVGHNKVYDIIKVGGEKGSITFCDCLFNKDKGLVLNI